MEMPNLQRSEETLTLLGTFRSVSTHTLLHTAMLWGGGCQHPTSDSEVEERAWPELQDK